MKKGQGLSISTIVLAAIALLVLVILAVLILRAGTDTATGTQDCEAVDGTPIEAGQSCEGILSAPHPTIDNCCIDISPE